MGSCKVPEEELRLDHQQNELGIAIDERLQFEQSGASFSEITSVQQKLDKKSGVFQVVRLQIAGATAHEQRAL